MTGEIPSQDAVTRNDPAAVASALDGVALDAYLRDGARWSWLAGALRPGHREPARAFLDHPRDFLWESQCWSLHGLAQGPHDDVEMLMALLDRDAHLPYVEDGTPLEHTIAESGHPRMAEVLFGRGRLIPAILDSAGWVPLFRAVRAGDVAMAQVFFDHGAPLNSRIEWRDRRSALHIALEARMNREAIVTWLLDLEIDTRLSDEAGRTAAERAVEAGEDALSCSPFSSAATTTAPAPTHRARRSSLRDGATRSPTSATG